MLIARLAYLSTLKTEATCSSETSADFQGSTGHYIREHRTFCKGLLHVLFCILPQTFFLVWSLPIKTFSDHKLYSTSRDFMPNFYETVKRTICMEFVIIQFCFGNPQKLIIGYSVKAWSDIWNRRMFCLSPWAVHCVFSRDCGKECKMYGLSFRGCVCTAGCGDTAEGPLWRVVLHQNEITASHFVAESLMKFSRLIVVTDLPYRIAIAIWNLYRFLFPNFLFLALL
jgi:hypothetical protein